MAQFREVRTPYEFLVRWNNDGTISGAHIAFLDTLYKNNEILSQTPSDVESVEMAMQEGFPLADVLSITLIDALKETEHLRLLLDNASAETERLRLLLDNVE